MRCSWPDSSAKENLNVGFPKEKVLVSVFLVRYHHLDAGNWRCFLQWYWWLLWALLLLLLLMWLGWQWLWGAAGGRQSRRLLLASGGPIATNKMGDHVHRDWKYNGGVFLVANTAQSLQKGEKRIKSIRHVLKNLILLEKSSIPEGILVEWHVDCAPTHPRLASKLLWLFLPHGLEWFWLELLELLRPQLPWLFAVAPEAANLFCKKHTMGWGYGCCHHISHLLLTMITYKESLGFFLYVLVCVDRKLLCRTHGTIYITQRRVLVSSFPHLFKASYSNWRIDDNHLRLF